MSDPAAPPPDRERIQLSARNTKERVLVFIVVFLGLLIVAGLAAVVLRIIYLSANPAPQAASGSAPAVATTVDGTTADGLAAARLALPAGAAVKSLALDGDRLAIHYESAAGAGIAIVDMRSGALIRRFELPSQPR